MFDYRAQLLRPIDGDSIWVTTDRGARVRTEDELRLLDVRAPELLAAVDPHDMWSRTVGGRPMRLPVGAELGAMETKAFVDDWFARCDRTRRWPLYVFTVPNTLREPEEKRTFNRYLAVVYDIADQTRCLNADVRWLLSQHPEWPSGA